MRDWVLKVELNGEWEECCFPTQRDALDAFAALSADYQVGIARAILFTADQARAALLQSNTPAYIH